MAYEVDSGGLTKNHNANLVGFILSPATDATQDNILGQDVNLRYQYFFNMTVKSVVV